LIYIELTLFKGNQMKFGILFLGYSFLYLPLIFLVSFSFNEAKFPGFWTSFSWKWYQELFKNVDLIQATFTSLKIAFMSATLSTILGLSSSLIIRRAYFRKRFLTLIFQLPLITPEIILGLSLLLLFVGSQQLFGFPNGRGILTVMIGHVTLSVAYVTLIVSSRLNTICKNLEEAALDLGASLSTVFFTITLPLIAKSLLISWALSFILSLDDVILASFLSGPGATTLPVLVFSNLRLGITPELNALATLMILFISIITLSLCGFFYIKESKLIEPAVFEPMPPLPTE
jgi:putrescine transport system permease protein